MSTDGDNSERIILRFEGESYDVTSYLEDHPGGAEILKGLSGEDVTQRILTQDAHTRVLNFIRSKLKKMKVEPVDGSYAPADQAASL